MTANNGNGRFVEYQDIQSQIRALQQELRDEDAEQQLLKQQIAEMYNALKTLFAQFKPPLRTRQIVETER